MSTIDLSRTPKRPMALGAAISGVLALAILPVASAQATKGHSPVASAQCAAHPHGARHGARKLRTRVCSSHSLRRNQLAPAPAGSGAPGSGSVSASGGVSAPSSAARRDSSASASATTTTTTETGTSGSGSLVPLQGGACDNSTLSTPFAAYGDTNQYKLVPGGNFENGLTGWSVGGGAQVVSGNAPLSGIGGGTHSLLLTAGSSVRAPYSCVNASYPSLRIFAHTNSLLATVAVSLEYNNLLGLVSVPVGVVTLSPGWEPSMSMLTASAVAGLVSGGSASVAVRFTALLGNSQIDDVFIDPRMRY